MATKTVIINLQKTPDDEKADLRIFGGCDEVFLALMKELGMEIEQMKPWYPQHAKPLDKLPRWLEPFYKKAAIRLHQTMKELEDLSEKQSSDGKKEHNDHNANAKPSIGKSSSNNENSNIDASDIVQATKKLSLMNDLTGKQQLRSVLMTIRTVDGKVFSEKVQRS
jgi:hypothetical protein